MNELMRQMIGEIQAKAGVSVKLDRASWKAVCVAAKRTDPDSAVGCYWKNKKIIFINPDYPTNMAWSTFFHELTHATYDVLGRRLEYGIEEGVAETSAGILLRYFELEIPEIVRKRNLYLHKYLSDVSQETIDIVNELATEASHFILTEWLSDSAQAIKKAA